MLDFKANMCLHYSCADRTANLQCYLHASSAPGGHPAHTELSLDSQSKRCTYINNIKNVNLWKCRIYFYKQRGQQCSSWEQKKAAKDTAHGNKRAWMSSVLSLQTSHQTGVFFLSHIYENILSVTCVAWGKHTSSTSSSADVWAISVSTYGYRWNPRKKTKGTKYTAAAGLLVIDASHRNRWSNEY